MAHRGDALWLLGGGMAFANTVVEGVETKTNAGYRGKAEALLYPLRKLSAAPPNEPPIPDGSGLWARIAPSHRRTIPIKLILTLLSPK